MNKTEIDKILEGRSFREMEVRALTADEGGEDSYLVEGYATTFNQPYVLWQEEGWTLLEQVDRHAFDNTDMTDVIMQYDHCGRVFARKSNGTLALTIDDHGLKVRADLSGTDIGRQLYQEIKGGYTTKMSFGFIIDEGGDRRETTEEDGSPTSASSSMSLRCLCLQMMPQPSLHETRARESSLSSARSSRRPQRSERRNRKSSTASTA